MKPLTIAEFRKAASDPWQKSSCANAIIRAHITIKADQADGKADSRQLTFIASDETVDRYGDIVRADGWQLDNFRKNPVILWGHDHYALPIGKALDIDVKDKALTSLVEFAPVEVNPFAEQAYQAYRGGFLSAVSVGFMALEWEWVDAKDPENLGIVFVKSELLEFSAVTVPANPSALVQGERSAKMAAKNAPPSVYRKHVQTRKEFLS